MSAAALLVLALLSAPSARTSTAPVDVNTASVAALTTLPGVGPVIAERIVQARARRPFTSAGDLERRVRGVGPRMVTRWGPRLVVSRPPRTSPPRPTSARPAAKPARHDADAQPPPAPPMPSTRTSTMGPEPPPPHKPTERRPSPRARRGQA